MKTINTTHLGFDFFMGGQTEVASLEEGAREHGGATQFADRIVSNIEDKHEIEVYEGNNTLSLYIPSTLDVDQETSTSEHVNKYLYTLQAHYPQMAFKTEEVRGSWYSEDMDKVVVEDITIISLNKEDITLVDIATFRIIAEQVKADMAQESVSITFNGALALI